MQRADARMCFKNYSRYCSVTKMLKLIFLLCNMEGIQSKITNASYIKSSITY